MKILIAEDDPILGDGLARSLRQTGHAVDWARDGAEADGALKTEPYDLLILDLGMPRLTGLEVLARLRGRGQRLPVLILTAVDGTDNRVKGLDLGADDYLTKPFELPELEARVRALLRRGMCGAPTLMEFGPLSYDQVGRVAYLDGAQLELSARELGLLEILMRSAGRLVPKQQLAERLYEWGEEASANAIEVCIHRLRKKIEHGAVRIVTARGLGYCLEKA